MSEMIARDSSNVSHLPVIPAATELLPLIPEGVYSFAFVAHETHRFFNRSDKAVLWFRVLDFGDHFNKVLPRYYNVRRLIGKPGRNGNFAVGRSSDLLREFCCVSTAPITRLDRLPLTTLQNVTVRARVRVVSKDGYQKALPETLHYSVVDEIVGRDQ
jgi:hypothetical protein